MEEAISKSIDKSRLSKALSFKSYEERMKFGTGQVLPSNTLKNISFDQTVVAVPVSNKDFERLKLSSKPSPYGKGLNLFFNPLQRLAWEIGPSQVILPQEFYEGFTSFIFCSLDFPAELQALAEIQLNKVILYENGGHYTRDYESGCVGSFGKVILQIPVEGGHDGGCLKISYKGKSETFQTQENSHQKVYAMAFFDNCEHSMETITRGSKLTLVYDLIWTNAKSFAAQDLPAFITALREVKETLVPWNPAHRDLKTQEVSKETELCSPEVSKETEFFSPEVSSYEVILEKQISNENAAYTAEEGSDWSTEMDSDEGSCIALYQKKNNNDNCSTKASDVFFVVLEEKYDKNISFNRLRGKDQMLANLLLKCQFVDVHLANVKHQIAINGHDYYGCGCCGNSSDEDESTREKSSYEILHWMDSEDRTVDLKMDLNWESQCIGPTIKCASQNRGKPDKSKESSRDRGCYEVTVENKIFFHHILVFWPKVNSFELYSRYAVYSQLEKLERLFLMSSSETRESVRLQVIQDLKRIVSLLSSKLLEHGNLTLRLLRLCTLINARDEGLDLLKKLGQALEHKPANRSFKQKDKIDLEQVAEIIADFECQVTGWKDMADLIKPFITPEGISESLVLPIKLAKRFLDVQCIEGAKMVGDCLTSSFNTTKSQSLSRLKQSDVETYLDFIISLEKDPETSNPERIASFTSFFSNLEPSVQCKLVLKFDAESSLKGSDCGKLVFHNLCQNLPRCNLLSLSATPDIFQNLLSLYIKLGNADWLEFLISNICRKPLANENAKHLNSTKHGLLQNLITSPETWEMATTTQLGKTMLASLVNQQLNLLVDQLSNLDQEFIKKQQPAVHNKYVQDYEFRTVSQQLQNLLSSCLKLVLKMKRHPDLADSNQISHIIEILSRLSAHQLGHILVAVFQSSSERLNKHPSTNGIIRKICQIFLSKMKDKASVMHPRPMALETLRCFIKLCDASSVRSLVECMVDHEMAGSWDYKEKYDLFKYFISSSDIWSALDSDSKLLVLNSCANLIEVWITDLCKIFSGEAITNYHANVKEILARCADLFVLLEKNRFETSQKNVALVFQQLFPKLPAVQLFYFLIDFHASEVNAIPSMKKFDNCIQWFRDACRCFFEQNFLSVIDEKYEFFEKTVRCLLWIRDDQSWQYFQLIMCTCLTSDNGQHLVRMMSNNNGIQEEFQNCPAALAAFNKIADCAEEQSKLVKEPAFNWSQPKAKLPQYPAVQVFLRAPDQEVMNYTDASFRTIIDARRLATQLEKSGHFNGFSVTVVAAGSGRNSCCVIKKDRNFFSKVRDTFLYRNTELNKLVKMRNDLNERAKAKKEQTLVAEQVVMDASDFGTMDDVHILPPVKRVKLDVPLIDLFD